MTDRCSIAIAEDITYEIKVNLTTIGQVFGYPPTTTATATTPPVTDSTTDDAVAPTAVYNVTEQIILTREAGEDVCVDGVCSAVFRTSLSNVSTYRVSVRARNLFGLSDTLDSSRPEPG